MFKQDPHSFFPPISRGISPTLGLPGSSLFVSLRNRSQWVLPFSLVLIHWRLKMSSVPAAESYKESLLLFYNDSNLPVKIIWVNGEAERHYYTLQPNTKYCQATYSDHLWRIKSDDDRVIDECRGDTATIVIDRKCRLNIRPKLRKRNFFWELARNRPIVDIYTPSNGAYRRRGNVKGIRICAFDCVPQHAIYLAARTMRNMLRYVHRSIIQQMAILKVEIAIIGRDQKTTDIPAHRHLKGSKTEDGRDYDSGTRGLGGTTSNPVTSVGEENITMVNDDQYRQESILVHELAHAVMNLGLLGRPERRIIQSAYKNAVKNQLHDPSSYLMSNADEYWAEGSQAWFHATIRMDVTAGMTSRELISLHDPELAAALRSVWGEGSWRFTDTAPREFSKR